MKQTTTYIIKHKLLDAYITNKPSDNTSEINYSTNFSRAREFNGLDNASIDMSDHIAIMKIVTETTEYKEVHIDG